MRYLLRTIAAIEGGVGVLALCTLTQLDATSRSWMAPFMWWVVTIVAVHLAVIFWYLHRTKGPSRHAVRYAAPPPRREAAPAHTPVPGLPAPRPVADPNRVGGGADRLVLRPGGMPMRDDWT